MARYRKRPVVIEAFRWHGELVEGYQRIGVGLDERSAPHYNLVLPTLEGEMFASEGDWIITGVKGEVYCCRNDIFELTYEAVEEGG